MSLELGIVDVELECASRQRRSLLYVPESASPADAVAQPFDNSSANRKTLDTQRPLLIACHGGSGQAEQMERLTGFIEIARLKKFFVAYPQGLNRHWNDGRHLQRRKDIDDVEFLTKLVDHLRQSFRIDPRRVFVCGISNGGFFAQYLAARAPGVFAAAASVAATVHEPMYNEIVPHEPVPMMFVVGKDDPVIPFAGGDIELASRKAGHVVPAENGFDYWASANRASRNFEEEKLPALVSDDDTQVIRRLYPAEENGQPVLAYIVEGGGHAWPCGWQYYREKYIGKTSRQLNTSEAIVEFFMQFSRQI